MIATVLAAETNLYIYLEKQYNRFTESHVIHDLGSRGIAECCTETSLTNNVHLGILLLIVFHEFIIYPLFQCCVSCARIKSLIWKILIAIIIQILRVTTLIAIDIISQHNY